MELLERLNNIPGVNIPREGITLRPKVYLSTLREESILQQFFNVLQWLIGEVKGESLSGELADEEKSNPNR